MPAPDSALRKTKAVPAPPRAHALDVLRSRVSVPPTDLVEPCPTPDLLDEMLAAALAAPDHGRLRPARFAIVRGDFRAALAELLVEATRRRDPSTPDATLERVFAVTRDAPLIVVVGAVIRPAHRVPEHEQLLSVGASAMNLLNAAHALGYGAFWRTGPNADDPLVRRAFGLEEPNRLVGFVHVGTRRGPATSRPAVELRQYARPWNGRVVPF